MQSNIACELEGKFLIVSIAGLDCFLSFFSVKKLHLENFRLLVKFTATASDSIRLFRFF